MIPAMTAYDAASRAGIPTGRITDEQWSVVKGAIGNGAGKPKRPVEKLSESLEILETYESIAEAAKKNDTTSQGIYAVCSGRTQTCKGFRYRYAD